MPASESDAEDTIVVDSSPIPRPQTAPALTVPTPNTQSKAPSAPPQTTNIPTDQAVATPTKRKVGRPLGSTNKNKNKNPNGAAATPPKKKVKVAQAPKPKVPTNGSADTPTAPPKRKVSQCSNPNITPDESADTPADTPPKRKRGRPPKRRLSNEGKGIPAPAEKRKKPAKAESFIVNGPPGYLTDPNRNDIFANQARVMAGEAGSVRPVGMGGAVDIGVRLDFPRGSRAEGLEGGGYSGNLGSGISLGDSVILEPPPAHLQPPPVGPSPPPAKPNNHRYLAVNPTAYGGADPRHYNNPPPKTPTPPRTSNPWPESIVDRGTTAPGIVELPLKYDPVHNPNGLRIPQSDARSTMPEERTDEQRTGLIRGYDAFAPPPDTVRGYAISYERSTATSEADGAVQTVDKEGRAGWVPWEEK